MGAKVGGLERNTPEAEVFLLNQNPALMFFVYEMWVDEKNIMSPIATCQTFVSSKSGRERNCAKSVGMASPPVRLAP